MVCSRSKDVSAASCGGGVRVDRPTGGHGEEGGVSGQDDGATAAGSGGDETGDGVARVIERGEETSFQQDVSVDGEKGDSGRTLLVRDETREVFDQEGTAFDLPGELPDGRGGCDETAFVSGALDDGEEVGGEHRRIAQHDVPPHGGVEKKGAGGERVEVVDQHVGSVWTSVGEEVASASLSGAG